MDEPQKKIEIDFLNIAPYVRYVQEYHGYDGYRIQQRMIYDHEIIFVKKGKCVYQIEDRKYVLQTGDIHFMRPHVWHSCHVPEGEEFDY